LRRLSYRLKLLYNTARIIAQPQAVQKKNAILYNATRQLVYANKKKTNDVVAGGLISRR
jgi:hypothetical protein